MSVYWITFGSRMDAPIGPIKACSGFRSPAENMQGLMASTVRTFGSWM